MVLRGEKGGGYGKKSELPVSTLVLTGMGGWWSSPLVKKPVSTHGVSSISNPVLETDALPIESLTQSKL